MGRASAGPALQSRWRAVLAPCFCFGLHVARRLSRSAYFHADYRWFFLTIALRFAFHVLPKLPHRVPLV